MLKIAFSSISAHKHQILHAFPVAMKLTEYPDVEVSFLTHNSEEENFLLSLAKYFGKRDFSFQRFKIPGWLSIISKKRSLYKYYKKLLLLKNLSLYRAFDAVVVPDITSSFLKRIGLKGTKLIRISHGAGDRSNFLSRRMSFFDLLLLPGEKYLNCLINAEMISPDQAAIVGYPKFEMVERMEETSTKLFENNRTTVVYNPHHDKKFSSWMKWGKEVLDFFVYSNQYNLIFAPHVRMSLDGTITDYDILEYRKYSNIIIDLGSDLCIDMTYTSKADIYLGDVSGQVYEFICNPRPCIFLNANGVEWRNNPNFKFWDLGPVVNSISELGEALQKSWQQHPQIYKPIQENYFQETFNFSSNLPSQEAANAILRVL